MKSDFVSNVSHELRTPLASIRVFGEFLRLGRVEERGKVREYGEYIETESRRLTQLINNILDFSKIESGAKTYELRAGPIERSVVRTPLRTLEVGLKHKGFGLSVTYDPPADADPAVDESIPTPSPRPSGQSGGQRRQVLQRDSNGDQGLGSKRPRNGATWSIRSRITGSASPAASRRRSSSASIACGTGLVHDVKGSGLGLSIVSHIVQRPRRRGQVESEPRPRQHVLHPLAVGNARRRSGRWTDLAGRFSCRSRAHMLASSGENLMPRRSDRGR